MILAFDYMPQDYIVCLEILYENMRSAKKQEVLE
jgi:hypothetical protein